RHDLPSLPFPIYDADNHLYESEEAFLRHLPSEFAGRIEYLHTDSGRIRLVVDGTVVQTVPNPSFVKVAAPGTHEKWYRATNTEGLTLRQLGGVAIPAMHEWRDGEARLRLFDAQGIHAAIVYPTMASMLQYYMRDDAALCGAALHSLNL